jgi:hypothetical protein
MTTTVNGKIMPTESALSLAELANEIRSGVETLHQTTRNALRIAFSVGNALLQARAQVVPGRWAKWLKANCFMSQRSADLYMQVAQHRDELEERMAEVPTLSLRAAARWIAKPRTTPKKAPPRPKPTLQEAWNKAALSERATVLARMPLADLLQIVPPSFMARLYASGKAAPDSEPFLKASEVLRRALSLLKTPSEPNTNEALTALRLLNGLLANAGIDEITVVQRYAKERRRAATRERRRAA